VDWKNGIARRAFVLGILGVAAVLLISGCSSVEPGDGWTEQTGTVSGTIRSDEGTPLADIEVWLWAELDTDGTEVQYNATSDASGYYTFTDVEIGTGTAMTQDYHMCANRTPERTVSRDTRYGTWQTSVTVTRDAECTRDIVLETQDQSPSDYIEN
jgi:hypothetical protein